MIHTIEKEKPLISVIVPVYNSEQFLRHCLDSIAQQTYSNLEIICVDDGSTDTSGAILDEYAAKDSRFKIIHQVNGGQASARNAALDIATGDWVANVDSDDYLELHAYEKVAEQFEDDIDMVWIGNHVVGDLDEELMEQQRRFYELKYSGKQTLSGLPVASMSGAVWNKIIRRPLLEKYRIRYPRGVVFEDLCYWACVVPIIGNVYFLPEPLYFYLQRVGSTMDAARSKASEKAKDVLKIIPPMYKFYSSNKLFREYGVLYDSFFVKFYSLAHKFVPDEMRDTLLFEARALVKKYGARNEACRARLMEKMMKQVFGADRIKSIKFLGIPLYHSKKTWCGAIRKFLGIKYYESKITLHATYKRTLFVRESAGRKDHCFMSIPLYSVIVRNGVKKKKILGVTVYRRKLRQPVKPAATQPIIYANISYLMPNQRVAGKKIVITGGARGLGFSMARKLMDEGADVLIAGRNQELLAEKAAELGCKYLPIDVQDVASFPEFIKQADEMLDGMNCLVNNAGISVHEVNIRQVTPEGFDSQLDTNLRGAYFLSQAFIKLMEEKKRRDGSILFISSERGLFVDDIPYGLSKAAMNSLVQGLAVRMLPSGIRVNAIAPGITASDMTGFKADGNLYCGYNASKRVFLPEEVSETACFLLSDCSRCITGQIIACDEGRAINPHWRRPQ